MPDSDKNKTTIIRPEVVARSFLGKASQVATSQVEDPFQESYGKGQKILEPPFNPTVLAKLPSISPALGQCINVLVTNVFGFGWDLEQLGEDANQEEPSAEAKNEQNRLYWLFDSVNINQDLTALQTALWNDLECTGNAYMEVVRGGAGDIIELHRLPSATTRLTTRDEEYTDVEQPVRDRDGRLEKRPRRVRFRRYVQHLPNGKKSWFKEFWDPRAIDPASGDPVGSIDEPANSVIHFSLGCGWSDYGVPRWYANLMGILGNYQAASVNYYFFENKSIPPIIITVSGGSLTQETIAKLEDMFKYQLKGLENFHKGLVLEAIPADVGEIEGEKVATCRIDIKPLTQFIPSDAQFLKYQDANDTSLVASFKMPPIYLGKSDDYNRATSMEARRMGEQQVFEPIRRAFDYRMNATILAEMGIKNWRFYTLGAPTTDYGDMLSAIGGVKEAVPVKVVLDMISEMRGTPMEEIPDELANTLLGLLGRAGMSEEPGGNEDDQEGRPQPDDDEDDVPEPTEKAIGVLLNIRKGLQAHLDKEAAA